MKILLLSLLFSANAFAQSPWIFGAGGPQSLQTLSNGVCKATSNVLTCGGAIPASSYTAGSVIFSDGTNLVENNSKFFWDNTNYRLLLGDQTSLTGDVNGAVRIWRSLLDPSATAVEGIYVGGLEGDFTTSSPTAMIGMALYPKVIVAAGESIGGLVGSYIPIGRVEAGDDGTVPFVVGYLTNITSGNSATKTTSLYAAFMAAFTSIDSNANQITNMYDFYAQSASIAAGAVTTRYGIVIEPDSNYTKSNWLSGKSQFGGASVSPNAAVDIQGNAIQGDGTTRATGTNAVAFGSSSDVGNLGISSGNYSYSFGSDNISSGQESFSAGFGNVSEGIRSATLNHDNVAHGQGSLAINSGTQANSTNSFAANFRTQANADNSTAVGEWNTGSGSEGNPDPTDDIFIVGNGTGSGASRHTAFAVRRDGLVKINNGHLRSTQVTAPTTTPNANSGTSATCTVSNASDLAGQIQIVTGSAAWAAGAQCAMTFNVAYDTAPKCVMFPVNANASLAGTNTYLTKSTTALTINFANADTAATAYQWDYHCVETY